MSNEIIKKAIYKWKHGDNVIKITGKVPIGGLTIIMPKIDQEKMKDVTPKNLTIEN